MLEQTYLKNIPDHIQRPIQELITLNFRTLQNFSYLRPEELNNLRQPEDILQKNVAVFFENGYKTLSYFQQAFSIFEKHLLSLEDQVQDQKIGSSNWYSDRVQ